MNARVITPWGLLACVLAVAPARASIVAHYTFDETSGTLAHDSTGGVDGTIAGSAAFVAGGISGNAISLNNATRDLVNMGNNFGTLPSSGFSMKAWIRTTQTTGQIPVSKHNGGTLNGFLLAANDVNPGGGGLGATGKATAYVSSSNNPAVPISTTTVNDGQWHQLLGVYKPGGQLSLYVDGVFQNSTSAQPYAANTSAFIVGGIGQNNSDGIPQNVFTGLVDDVQLYNTPLTASDATFLFTHPGQVVPEPTTLATLAAGATLRRRPRTA
jgi:hypothetical protein